MEKEAEGREVLGLFVSCIGSRPLPTTQEENREAVPNSRREVVKGWW
jgi:hypothetical protein